MTETIPAATVGASGPLSPAALHGELGAVRRGLRATDDEELLARVVLAALAEPGDGVAGRLAAALGHARLAALLRAGTGAAALHEAAVAAGETLAARQLGQAMDRWRPRMDAARIALGVRRAAAIGARLLVPGDEAWPSGLDDLGEHAPHLLWVRGDPGALRTPGVALVGARAATGYGQGVAIELAAGLADRGMGVVSGGAYGIDGAAHRSALASGGTTVAYLAGGIDRLYPAGHEELLRSIIERGAVASEVPPGSAPTKWRFLQRNRCIAAASAATVVVEAGLRSGSLNTAAHAATLGRPLGAVPGPVTSPASAGCHRLLREFDAVCIVDAGQAGELAGIEPGELDRPAASTAAASPAPPQPARAGSTEVRVRDALSRRTARSVGEIAARSGLSTAEVMGVLGRLDLEGAASRRPEGWVAVRAAG
ncbi:DNA-processing protein DprA [Agromyces archimandritae]|uniref:DNA-processing protein DprA n=1 Tax=Agromyces archimandritae TaxID=2781962 RepID=A0A975IND0_9MICO|nr:DNA-processing protein DprA [Agromyces archimandritae]QTX04492.1 DNA-processing protein DprA [Agromyces archimandritae]